MPLPAPGTLELLRGASTVETAGAGEYVTPTGAAILTTIVDHYGPIPSLIIESIGYGVGDRDPKDRPNLLRLLVGKEAEQELAADLLLEANIDDMSPELYGHLSELAFKAGAADVWLTPIQMKKGRPGTTLSLLCQRELRTPLIDLVLRESTTLGLRILPIERYCTTRTVEALETPMGTVRIKIARDGHRIVNRAPEYEDCKQLALKSGLPLKIVYQRVQALLEQQETDA